VRARQSGGTHAELLLVGAEGRPIRPVQVSGPVGASVRVPTRHLRCHPGEGAGQSCRAATHLHLHAGSTYTILFYRGSLTFPLLMEFRVVF
jgi:hypothetical protein